MHLSVFMKTILEERQHFTFKWSSWGTRFGSGIWLGLILLEGSCARSTWTRPSGRSRIWAAPFRKMSSSCRVHCKPKPAGVKHQHLALRPRPECSTMVFSLFRHERLHRKLFGFGVFTFVRMVNVAVKTTGSSARRCQSEARWWSGW